MRRLRLVLIAFLVLFVAFAVVYVTGPREPADLTVRVDREAIAEDPSAYLTAQEASVPGIRPGLQKEVVYAYPQSRAKTPLAIVYVHGFSASRGEIEPVVGNVAAAFGANTVYTRLAGHGRDGAAMGEATVNAWVNDLAEALTAAEAIGERTVVLATSTGATLATLAAANTDLIEQMDALVQISPNYALRNRLAFVLDLPFAEQIVRLAEGEERSFEPVNEKHAAFWTSRYPSRAVLPMAALVRAARGITYERLTLPTLFLFSEEDTVVDPAATREVAARWGSAVGTRVNIETIADTDDPYRHVIAGDALSPSTTERATTIIVDWIASAGLADPIPIEQSEAPGAEG